MVTAGRQAQALDGRGKQFCAAGVGLAPRLDLGAGQPGVGFALAGELDRPALRHPFAHRGRGLAGGGRLEVGDGQRGHFEEQVDAIEQRPGELAAVAGDLVGRASAAPVRVAVVAAGAGVHRRDELEAGREFGPAGGAGDGDVAGFEGLAQGFEHAAVEFGEFVEEQHAVVRQADFAWARGAATAHQRRRGGRVVRRTHGAQAPAFGPEAAFDGMHGGAFEGFVIVHGGQQAGQALGEHGFAGAGRAIEEQRVLPAGGDFERPAGLDLAFDIGQIGVGRGVEEGFAGVRRDEGVAAQVGDHRQQAGRREDGDALYQRRFGGIYRGQDQGAPAVCGLAGQRQRAAYRAQFAGQRQLAGKFEGAELVAGNLPRGGQNAEGDRQVETAAFLGQIRRGEVDGDAPLGKFELAGLQRGAHPVAGFAHFHIRQPDQREGGQPVGEVHLDAHLGGLQADEGAALQNGQAHDEFRIKNGV